MSIVISDAKWNQLYNSFLEFSKEKTGEDFRAFRNSRYVDREENYKFSVATEAKARLRVSTWAQSEVGTGSIKAAVERIFFETIDHNGTRIKNNLVPWRKRREFEAEPNDPALELLFYNFYKNRVSDSEVFEELNRRSLGYAFIAYLFFVKNRDQYLPIAPETFDRLFKEDLSIDFVTSRHASWENYQTFISIVRSAHRFLRSKDAKATLLDAHSFLWILARQMKQETKGASGSHFLQYWKPEQVEIDLESGGLLTHIGSNQFKQNKVGPGDTIWVVTLKRNENFVLVGRLRVGHVESYKSASAKLDYEVFERDFHVVVKKGFAEPMREIPIDSVAKQIRFDSASDRLEITNGKIDARQLQSIRRLTPGTVELLLSKWKSVEADLVESEILDQHAEEEIRNTDLPEVEKEQLIMARRGQGKFRRNLENIESRCRVTGIRDKRFLIASHIKPWRESTSEEKLDGHNGLLLSPHIDKLFDGGWISFDPDGHILCKYKDVCKILESWGVEMDFTLGPFNRRQNEYLKDHRRRFGFE